MNQLLASSRRLLAKIKTKIRRRRKRPIPGEPYPPTTPNPYPIISPASSTISLTPLIRINFLSVLPSETLLSVLPSETLLSIFRSSSLETLFNLAHTSRRCRLLLKTHVQHLCAEYRDSIPIDRFSHEWHSDYGLNLQPTFGVPVADLTCIGFPHFPIVYKRFRAPKREGCRVVKTYEGATYVDGLTVRLTRLRTSVSGVVDFLEVSGSRVDPHFVLANVGCHLSLDYRLWMDWTFRGLEYGKSS